VTCANAIERLHAYVDAELPPADALSIEAHLMECAACRREFETLLAGVETVRGAHGVYDTPETSRVRTLKLVSSHYRRSRIWRLAAVAALAAFAIGAFETVERRVSRNNGLGEFAAESHLRYARGTLPLDLKSEDPQILANWLSVRMPFRLKLPNYPEPAGKSKKYVLEGTRLLQLSDQDVAYLAYRMNGRPISLLMTASARLAPSGGDIYRSGGLAFHSTQHKGLRVITWTDKGLHYALVSEMATGGAESCMVCHGTEADHQKVEPLRPKL
jgi:anti-sigma factor RsiW